MKKKLFLYILNKYWSYNDMYDFDGNVNFTTGLSSNNEYPIYQRITISQINKFGKCLFIGGGHFPYYLPIPEKDYETIV